MTYHDEILIIAPNAFQIIVDNALVQIILRNIVVLPRSLEPKCCRTPDSILQAKIGLRLEFYVAF